MNGEFLTEVGDAFVDVLAKSVQLIVGMDHVAIGGHVGDEKLVEKIT